MSAVNCTQRLISTLNVSRRGVPCSFLLNNGGNYSAEITGTALHALDRFKFTLDQAQCDDMTGYVALGGDPNIATTNRDIEFTVPVLPPDKCSGDADREYNSREREPCCVDGGATCGTNGAYGGLRDNRYYLCYSPAQSIDVVAAIHPGDPSTAGGGDLATSIPSSGGGSSILVRDSGKPYIFDDISTRSHHPSVYPSEGLCFVSSAILARMHMGLPCS